MQRAPEGRLWWVVLFVGIHSSVLGVLMLALPVTLARWVGFTDPGGPFFPSQSGIFLLALGICYLLALRERALVVVILVSKSLAVLFLLAHVLFLAAPPFMGAAALVDACLLAATVVAMHAPHGRR